MGSREAEGVSPLPSSPAPAPRTEGPKSPWAEPPPPAWWTEPLLEKSSLNGPYVLLATSPGYFRLPSLASPLLLPRPALPVCRRVCACVHVHACVHMCTCVYFSLSLCPSAPLTLSTPSLCVFLFSLSSPSSISLSGSTI